MIGNKSSLISCIEMSLTYFGCYTGLSHLDLPLWGNMPKILSTTYQRLICQENENPFITFITKNI